ncbi:Type I phosphodiesterase / nucleotide pyrophosphatase [uncultured archaeon]|nr:Type I phosphodiesterase / nucleotide pyrophosphatase [uncultured archaeon]
MTRRLVVGVVLVCLVLWGVVVSESMSRDLSVDVVQGFHVSNISRVVLVSWDGVRVARLNDMLASGELGNLSAIIAEGRITNVTIADHSVTTTAPGHAAMLSGYGSSASGVVNNTCGISLPLGYSVFERLNASVLGLATGSVWGKSTCYVPDSLLSNARQSIWWWGNFSLIGGKYSSSRARAGGVANESLKFLSQYGNGSFFLFVHFTDPDYAGHIFSEGSAEYRAALVEADGGLGIITEELRTLGVYNETVIIITTDHGFEENGAGHTSGGVSNPDLSVLFVASNKGWAVAREGDRKETDVAATVYDLFNVNSSAFVPALDGTSLAVLPGNFAVGLSPGWNLLSIPFSLNFA